MRAKITKPTETAVLSDWQKGRLTRHERLMRSKLAPASSDLIKANPSAARWYCLTVVDGREIALGKTLADAGVEALVPTEIIERISSKGQRYEVKRPMFAGYAFVRLIPSLLAFERLRSVESGIDFLRSGECYQEVADADMGRCFCEIDRLSKDKSICDSSQVEVIYGPFAGMKAIVIQVIKPRSQHPKCRVWSELYQREIANVPLAFLRKL